MKKAQLQYKYPASIHEVVYAHLVDLRKFGEIHPSMTSVSVINTIDPENTEYLVKEEFKLGRLVLYRPEYTAVVTELQEGKHIVYKSHIKWDIHLSIDYLFESESNTDQILLTEKIKVAGNRLIASVFITLLRKVHFYTIHRLIQRNQ